MKTSIWSTSLGLQQKNGIPYQCARFVSGSDAVRFTENTNHWLDGASDGTMTNEEFARLVAQEMDRWGDPDDEYQDFIQYPCSYFWDSGFPLETKYKIAKFIAHRKNTNVSLATYIDGERPLTTSEEFSRHIAIIENVRILPIVITLPPLLLEHLSSLALVNHCSLLTRNDCRVTSSLRI